MNDLQVAKSCVLSALEAIEKSSTQVKKGPLTDPTTKADLAAEKAMRYTLLQERPHECILGEEYGGKSEATYWLLDPIDGTANFFRGFRTWSSVCAKIENGQAVCSVIAPKEWDTLCLASDSELHLQQIDIPLPKKLSQAAVATYTNLSRSQDSWFRAGTQNLFQGSGTIRSWGSASWEMLLVASGQIDAFVQYKMHPWDFLPGELFVRKSGGSTGTLGPWHIAARSSTLYEEISALLQDSRKAAL